MVTHSSIPTSGTPTHPPQTRRHHVCQNLQDLCDLGEDNQIDAPQANIQYAVLEPEGYQPELVEKMYFARTRKGTMSRPEFENWIRNAERL